jgi:hypothetical protein
MGKTNQKLTNSSGQLRYCFPPVSIFFDRQSVGRERISVIGREKSRKN